MKKLTLMALASASVLLVACGGGGGGDDVPQGSVREVPDSAMASPRAFSEYAGSLTPSDTTEPLSVDKVVAPVSETEAPISVS